MKDGIFQLEHTKEFVQIFRQMDEVGWSDFLKRLKVLKALQIASATTEEQRTKVHFNVLLIDELLNFTKSLLSIDTTT